MPDPLMIGVIGPSQCSERHAALARTVGMGLTRRGAVIVVGSLQGVSLAAAAAAAEAGGQVVHLAPGLDRPAPVAGIHSLPTGLGELCNGLIVRASDALVSIGGGWGTLLEIAFAMRTDTPVVMLEGWRVRDARGERLDGPAEADTADAAVMEAYGRAAARVALGAARLP
jgi:uncharacterized protein (TIGR00725 family)